MSEIAQTARHVAFYLLDFSGGGIERVNIYLANELAQRGYRVDIVVVRRRGEFAAQISSGVRVVELGRERAYECLWPLARYLRASKPAVLFTCFPTLNLVAIAAKLLAFAPTHIVPAEHMPVGVDRRENPSRLPRLAYRLYPLVYRFVPAVVVNCQESAEDFKLQFPSLAELVRVLYNPVVAAGLPQRCAELVTSGPLADSKLTSPVLVGAGRLTRQKNFPLLLRAFALVRQSINCELVIVGGRGEEREQLLRLAEELGIDAHVQWTGFVENPYAYFSRASLFVLSSLYETLPTVLIEALACGTPTVATDCFGVREILQDGLYGTVVTDFKPDTLAVAILNALASDQTRQPLRDRGQVFSVTASTDRYAALIEELMR